MTYSVVDNHTGKIMVRGLSLRSASRKVDRLDLAYGGYRYGYVFEVQP